MLIKGTFCFQGQEEPLIESQKIESEPSVDPLVSSTLPAFPNYCTFMILIKTSCL